MAPYVRQMMTPSDTLTALQNIVDRLRLSPVIYYTAEKEKTDDAAKQRYQAMLRIEKAEKLVTEWENKPPNRIGLASAYTVFVLLVKDLDKSPDYLGCNENNPMHDSLVAIQQLAARFHDAAQGLIASIEKYQATTNWSARLDGHEEAYLEKVIGEPLRPGWSLVFNDTVRIQTTGLGQLAVPQPGFINSWMRLASYIDAPSYLENDIVGYTALVPKSIADRVTWNMDVDQLHEPAREDLYKRVGVALQQEFASGKERKFISFRKTITRALAVGVKSPIYGGGAA